MQRAVFTGAPAGEMKEQKMMSRWIRSRPLVMAGALVLGLTVVSQALGAAPTLWLMTFTIDADQPYAVSADALGPFYNDYRLGTGLPDDPDYCVETVVSGGLFLKFNRNLDGAAGTQDCGLFGGSPRQYSLTVSDGDACEEATGMAGGYGANASPLPAAARPDLSPSWRSAPAHPCRAAGTRG
jgi:hypothetical protein